MSTNGKRFESIDQFLSFQEKLIDSRETKRRMVAICKGTSCFYAHKSDEVVEAVRSELEKRGLTSEVGVRVTGCLGFCEQGPILIIYPQRIFYPRVKAKDVPRIVEESVVDGKIIDDLLYIDPATGSKLAYENQVPFYQKQMPLVFGSNKEIDPRQIDDYIAIGGYSALAKVLQGMKPEQVIEIIKASGLRGRGGGGFPTGKKWESCRKASGERRFVVCNADEGDPGAYMDRSVLEGNPHSVLEGMIIGAYAIGSEEGYIYVRQEYPLAVEHFRIALEQAEERGFLGRNILGSGLNFEVRIARGGGAFVCGESTALMASIEGKPGEPRAKHIHTVERGLWDLPTNLNNVETWANVPLIINRGADWYASIGTEKSKGTKIFSLVGKVNNTGLVEVPMGITLREIVYDIGGGIKEGKKFKAVQTGGPSGGCVPESLIDLPVDFERLTEAGSMMGSGGMIVMDEENCMVDIAKYFTGFLKDESCGKCTTCREGLVQMYSILCEITEGRGTEEDMATLEDLCWLVAEGSLCQLGGSAPNPVLSTMRYFREEYEAHVKEKRCPAGVCKALIHYFIDKEKCTGCMLCLKRCPQGAIEGETKQPHFIIEEKCIKCGICRDLCKFEAVIRQ
ncbi:MAG: NADH-quinone oxidoreductase subunit NuoF [candidate division NC10 bacterium]|nr:NADH-quinone oxidoreductase subunit NuoF [candidate division NC10 bacterium]